MLNKWNRSHTFIKKRLDKAIVWYEKFNKKPIFIVSGSQGKDEIVSEAWAMKKYLINNGINEKNIIMEDKSTTTLENLKYSKDIMIKKIKNIYVQFAQIIIMF
ncbi:YdcF family protein (plasmid) [Clostridium perfringens]